MSLITKLGHSFGAVADSDVVAPYRVALAQDLAPHLTKRLRRRLRLLMFVGSVMLLIAAYDVAIHPAAMLLALMAAAIGLGIGLMMGRISLFSWDPKAGKVTARMDAVGAALLIVYIMIVTSRRELLGQWLTADTLAAASIAMAGGMLVGRNFSMRKRIHGVLLQVGLAPGRAAPCLGMVPEL